MFTQNQVIRFILAFKVKHLRLEKELSYQDLSTMTGLSTSYLSDIEKGKRYPKPDKISKLGEVLDVDYNYLVSTTSSKKLRPIIDLINSDFLKLFPLEEFGINMEKVLEMFSKTPDRVNAFISTLFMVARNYQITSKEFYIEAMRSYQDMHNNDFPELEKGVEHFKEEYSIRPTMVSSPEYLEEQLEEIFDIKVDRNELSKNKKLTDFRSFFSEKEKKLFIDSKLSSAQRNFLFAKELGFQFLNLKQRPYEVPMINIDSFEKILNNYKASHFAAAMTMPPEQMVNEIKNVMASKEWSNRLIFDLLKKYNVTPETLLQRWTNLLPKYFGLEDLFFIKLTSSDGLEKLTMSKNLHLAQVHTPYNNRLNEQFCRRWVAYKSLNKIIKSKKNTVVQAQISEYLDSGNAYLCISIAQRTGKKKLKSTTLGLLVNEKLRSNCYFISGLEKTKYSVGTTCERCSVIDCAERIIDPIFINEIEYREDINSELKKFN